MLNNRIPATVGKFQHVSAQKSENLPGFKKINFPSRLAVGKDTN